MSENIWIDKASYNHTDNPVVYPFVGR